MHKTRKVSCCTPNCPQEPWAALPRPYSSTDTRIQQSCHVCQLRFSITVSDKQAGHRPGRVEARRAGYRASPLTLSALRSDTIMSCGGDAASERSIGQAQHRSSRNSRDRRPNLVGGELSPRLRSPEHRSLSRALTHARSACCRATCLSVVRPKAR